VDSDLWKQIQAAHKGYQAGNEILSLLPYIAQNTGYFELHVASDLSIYIPEKLFNPDYQADMAKVLAPPPVAKSNEILASSGGMFYACEAPGLPPFVVEGSHFEVGQPLYIVEVMKMFNKIKAPFAGTIEKVLVTDDGSIIKKGQPLFTIVPDEKVVIESPEATKQRKADATEHFLKNAC